MIEPDELDSLEEEGWNQLTTCLSFVTKKNFRYERVKPYNSLVRLQSSSLSQVQASAGHLAISPEGRQTKTPKSMAQLSS